MKWDDSGRGRILSSNLQLMKGIVVTLAVAAGVAHAQSASPTLSDATVVSRGTVRVGSGVQWTRIDGIFGRGGSSVLPLGSSLSMDLNVATLPLLQPGQQAAQLLAADPSLTFSAGQLTTSVDSRVASVPITVEYGLSSRLTVGVMIPVVQSRSVLTYQLNGRADNTANVGANPSAFHGSTVARAANASVATGLTAARDQLSQRVATCAASPFSPGCDAVNARADEAAALIAATSSFAVGVATLYGISDDAIGSIFVPIAGSDAQAAIDARLAQLRASYTSFGFTAGAASLAPAQAPAANAQFNPILTGVDYGIEIDSLGTTEQTTIGDIELGATMLLFNSFGAKRGIAMRAVAGGVVRLGTGHPARANRPFDVPTGDGQTDFELRGAVDALTGRFLTTVAGTFTLQTGSTATTRLPTSPEASFLLDFPVAGSVKYGNMASLRVQPRYLITKALMVGLIGVGSYRGADEVTVTGFNPTGTVFGNQNSLTTYAGGFSLSYSNLASIHGTGDRRFPAEIAFHHIETLGASAGGAEKGSRDSIELRLYLRSPR